MCGRACSKVSQPRASITASDAMGVFPAFSSKRLMRVSSQLSKARTAGAKKYSGRPPSRPAMLTSRPGSPATRSASI